MKGAVRCHAHKKKLLVFFVDLHQLVQNSFFHFPPSLPPCLPLSLPVRLLLDRSSCSSAFMEARLVGRLPVSPQCLSSSAYSGARE